jgi:fructose-1,6-bisphosphatase/inositol monophosphatase family enzyme
MKKTIQEVAIEAAKEAGSIAKEDFYNAGAYKDKGAHDVVTETDMKSEECILKIIKNAFPDHTVISEEAGKQIQGSEYSWYVDPIDGTSNFITGNPYFAISLGIARKGEIISGVVYNPLLDEMYVAEKGGGAFLNAKKIKVSTTSEMKNALVATAYSADEADIQTGINIQQNLALTARRVVLNFAPALDLCNIARGRIDGIIDNGSTPEDHAAASIILEEAGGALQNLHKDYWDVNTTGIVASNGFIHQSLCSFTQ